MNKTVLLMLACGLCVGAIDGPPIAAAKLVVPETPQVYEHVIVTTTDGWEYYNVTVELLAESNALRVTRPDGSVKAFPLSRVRVIQDQIGRDITRHVIPGWKGTPRDTTPTTSYPTESQSTRESEFGEIGRGVKYDRPTADEKRLDYRFRTALSFGAGYGWARGDWFEPVDEGPSYHVQARIALGGTVYLNLGYRFQELEVRPEYDTREVFGVNTPNLREYFIGLGFMPRRSHVMQAIPYLELGVGRIEHSWTPLLSDWLPLVPDDYVTVVATSEKVKTGLLGQVGMMMPMGKSIGLDLAVSATYTGHEPFDFRDGNYKGFVFGAQAALVLFIGD
jgi:hypothetical protein